MKKALLLLVSIGFAQIAVGQVFGNEDFSAYTIGNVGTDITGVTPGQGNYLTTSTNGAAPTTTTNSDNTNFQIVQDGGAFGQVLQITGPNGDKGNRFMWVEGLDVAWSNRTGGNDIIEVEYDLFTGDVTTSANNMRMYVYNADKTKILCGFSFAAGTKILSGVAYYDASAQPGGAVANYLFYLGTPVGTTPQNVILAANEWVRIGMSYNYITGEVKWKGPGFNANAAVIGAAPMTNPDELDIVVTSGTNATAVPPIVNAAAASVFYDNITASAQATDSLLGVAQPTLANEFSLYPNPVNDVLNITNSTRIQSVGLTDLNGRVVKFVSLDNVETANISVSDLASGMYLLNVATESGTITRKIIKN